VLESLVATTPREHCEKTTAKLIYNTVFGDIDVAAEAGRELVALSRGNGSLSALLRALRWASVPLKLTGNVTGALSFLTEAHDEALRLGLEAEVWNAVYYVGSIALDVEDSTLAQQCTHVFDRYAASGSRDPMRATTSAYFRARFALMEGNVSLAAINCALALELSAEIPRSPQMDLGLLALDVALKLETSEGQISPRILGRLRKLHDRTRKIPQDFEVAVLTTALSRSGRNLEGRQLCEAYLKVRRSRLRPLSRLQVARDDLLPTTP
jgi:hypothetical protein